MSSAYFADITNQLYYYWKTKKIATACWSFCSTLLPHIKESQYQVTVDTVFENHRKTLIHYCELKLAVKQYYQTGQFLYYKTSGKLKKNQMRHFIWFSNNVSVMKIMKIQSRVFGQKWRFETLMSYAVFLEKDKKLKLKVELSFKNKSFHQKKSNFFT